MTWKTHYSCITVCFEALIRPPTEHDATLASSRDPRFRQINDNLFDAFIHLVDQYEQQANLASETASTNAMTEASAKPRATNALVTLREPIHFHFNERWALKCWLLKKDSFELPASSASPPKYGLLDNRTREARCSLAKLPYLLSRLPHHFRSRELIQPAMILTRPSRN